MRRVLLASRRGIQSLACCAPSTNKHVAQPTEGNPQRFSQAADVTHSTPAIYSAGVYLTFKIAPVHAGCGRDLPETSHLFRGSVPDCLMESKLQRFTQAADVTHPTPAIYSAGVCLTVFGVSTFGFVQLSQVRTQLSLSLSLSLSLALCLSLSHTHSLCHSLPLYLLLALSLYHTHTHTISLCLSWSPRA